MGAAIKSIKAHALLAFFTVLIISASLSYAQTPAEPPQPNAPTNAQAAAAPSPAAATPSAPVDGSATIAAIPAGEINPNNIMPLVLNYWEHTAINESRKSAGGARPMTDAELQRALRAKAGDKKKPPPEEREIKLQGIVFYSADDWTIWLNGKRITPDALPKETLELKVFKDYVEMKWFDDYTNQIFPLRLRPHERFNIDTRIFLPG